MQTWMIFALSLAFWFALDALKEKKGGWWAEAHYLAHTAALALLAVVLTISVWTNSIDSRWVMGVLTFVMLRGLWEFWQDEHRKREERHWNRQMRIAIERERKRNPDFMKGWEVHDTYIRKRIWSEDEPDNAG